MWLAPLKSAEIYRAPCCPALIILECHQHWCAGCRSPYNCWGFDCGAARALVCDSCNDVRYEQNLQADRSLREENEALDIPTDDRMWDEHLLLNEGKVCLNR